MRVTKNGFFNFKDDHTIVQFDSVQEFVRVIDDKATSGSKGALNGYNDFYSNRTWQGMLDATKAGDADLAKQSTAMMNKIKGEMPDTTKRVRKASPTGRAVIGAYLASDPFPARVRRKEKTNTAPVAIVVSLNSLAECKTNDLVNRGVAIAAMIRRVAKERPVQLYLSRFSNAAGNGNSAMLVNFNTTPLDANRLAFLLADQSFCRGAGFAFHCAAPFIAGDRQHGKYTSFITFAGDAVYSQKRLCPYSIALERFLNKDVLYIPGSSEGCQEYMKIKTNAAEWINETVNTLTNK